MSVFEHWQAQKEELASEFSKEGELSDSLYQIRHAVLQTEQLSLAECENEMLRQEAGVLFAVVKNSLPLLEAVESGKIWRELLLQAPPKRSLERIFGWIGLALSAVCAVSLWMNKQLLFSLLCALSTVLTGCCLLLRKKNTVSSNDEELRVSLKIDRHALFSALDSQFRAMDRYLTDFQYLNDSLGTDSEGIPDARTVQRAASLLQALYGMQGDDEDIAVAIESARGLLSGLGFQCMDYTEENQRYFSVLPSRSFTKTLCPALFSLKDGTLLNKGKVVLPLER